jgi:PRTRC genetic system protein B
MNARRFWAGSELFYNHDDAQQYDSEQKAAKLNGRTSPQPRLVWRVDSGELKIRALAENKRPAAGTALAVAPFWILSDDGRVCTGTMRRPVHATAGSMPDWEQDFYESALIHANVGRLDG